MGGYSKNYINKSNAFSESRDKIGISRTIYYGEVLSIDDPTDGGRIKVKIKDLDAKISAIESIPWSYPLIPKYLHILPQVGEMVRVFIEDIKFPERSRFWVGSIISQPQKIGFDGKFTALSTTNQGILSPETAPSTNPEAKGVFPSKEDVGLIGRVNTDVLLKPNEVIIRAGKHENNNILKLNTKNSAQISLNFEQQEGNGDYVSSAIIMGDKLAFISHNGKPKFKSVNLDANDRKAIFEKGHPMVRGDVLLQILNIFKTAIINHIHGYSNLASDKTAIINELEKIDLSSIIQENIVIN